MLKKVLQNTLFDIMICCLLAIPIITFIEFVPIYHKIEVNGYEIKVSDYLTKKITDKEIEKSFTSIVNHVPEKILNDFYNEEFSINYTNQKQGLITKESSGNFNANRKKIFIRTDYIDANGIDIILLHELGHYVDYKLDYVSKSEEFKTICEEEVKNMWKYNEFYSSSEQYFAQSFAYYIYQDVSSEYKSMMVNTPRTYEYIKNCIENY